jgi:hypothetical protein
MTRYHKKRIHHSKKPKIGKCSYHLCEKQKTRLYRCKYCNEYFCHEHLYAKIPQTAPFKTTDIDRHEEWRKKGGHPCFPFFEYTLRKQKGIPKQYFPKLPRKKPIIGSGLLPILEPYPEPSGDEESDTPKDEASKEKKKGTSGTKIPDVKCYDCGKDLLHERNESFFDEELKKHIILCPECFNTRLNKDKKEKEEIKPVKTKPKKSLFQHSNKFISWFFWKKYPNSKLRYEKFGVQLTILICSSFLFWIIYSNIGQLNNIKLLFILLGSLILLILLFIVLRSFYRMIKYLRYGLRGLVNGYKTIISVSAIIICFYLFLNPNVLVEPITSFDYDSLNPFEINFNFTSDSSNDYYSYSDDTDGESVSLDELMTGPESVSFSYMLKGKEYDFDYTLYKGVNDYLASLPRSISYYTTPPTTKDFILRDLNQDQQSYFLTDFANSIKNITDDKDDQVRIAISIVQNIPYDWSSLYAIFNSGKFPYEVLYTNTGVCGEKSNLLVYLIRELGYGVVVFEFESDSHRAVGIKCPNEYSYKNTGFCFVESTTPTIITDSEGEYVGVGKLSSYEIIEIADGLSFDSVSEEYNDAQEFNRLNDLADSSGGILSQYNYNKWWSLVNKYGIEVG